MVVAGGEWQVPLVRLAKNEGHFVINTNLYADSAAFRYADVGLVANVLDRERNLAIACEYKPDAIVTDQSDIAVPTVAYVCEALGLPGIGVAMAERFTNKYQMRCFCRDHGFAHPAFSLCRNPIETEVFCRKNNYPVVLKPPANQSSRGVSIVRDVHGLQRAYEAALGASHDGTVLAEGFLAGTEVTVEGIKFPDRHVTLAISRKRHMAENPTVANQLLYSSSCATMDYDHLRSLNDSLVSAMGLSFGLTHAEYKHCGGRFTLVEIAARGGGTRISSEIVPAISGVPTNKLLIDMALGNRVEPCAVSRHSRAALLEFFEFACGRVDTIVGVEEALALPGVLDIGFTFMPGDVLRVAQDDRTRHGHIIAAGDSEDEVLKVVAAVRSLVKVHYG